jgi:hypothetical protein
MKAQEGINIGTLGMTATAYKKLHGIPEPINDNLPVTKVHTKNIALIIATAKLAGDKRDSISNAEGKEIGITSGIRASLILDGDDEKFNAQMNAKVAEKVAKLKKEIKAEEAANKKASKKARRTV